MHIKYIQIKEIIIYLCLSIKYYYLESSKFDNILIH